MRDEALSHVDKLLVARDITGIVAEYLLQMLHCFEGKSQQELVYGLCSNLNRALYMNELLLMDEGVHFQNRPYSYRSFQNVDYLDIDVVGIVKEYIDKRMKNQKSHKEKRATNRF